MSCIPQFTERAPDLASIPPRLYDADVVPSCTTYVVRAHHAVRPRITRPIDRHANRACGATARSKGACPAAGWEEITALSQSIHETSSAPTHVPPIHTQNRLSIADAAMASTTSRSAASCRSLHRPIVPQAEQHRIRRHARPARGAMSADNGQTRRHLPSTLSASLLLNILLNRPER
jgi:hypothetical protein